jgi:hypothetical protein
VRAEERGLKERRVSGVRVVLIVAGALTAGSLTWILWGLFTPGDYFAGGNPAVWGTLVVSALGGASAAGRIRSRWASALLLLSAALLSTFWIVAPDGWWASSPPRIPADE